MIWYLRGGKNDAGSRSGKEPAAGLMTLSRRDFNECTRPPGVASWYRTMGSGPRRHRQQPVHGQVLLSFASNGHPRTRDHGADAAPRSVTCLLYLGTPERPASLDQLAGRFVTCQRRPSLRPATSEPRLRRSPSRRPGAWTRGSASTSYRTGLARAQARPRRRPSARCRTLHGPDPSGSAACAPCSGCRAGRPGPGCIPPRRRPA